MSDKAIEVICNVLDRCPSILTYDPIIADDILDALKAARIAVVELPEPEVWSPTPYRYWRVDDTTVTVDIDDRVHITLDDNWTQDLVGNPGYVGPSPDRLRRLAAALTAAADAAEAVGDE